MQVNDLVPISSGFANLGVDVSSNGQNAFDITTLRPFGHIVQLSGIFVDPILGQSGVLRYSRAGSAFEVSVDGGASFSSVVTGATVVTSVGVLGDANLTGDVDLAVPASGFMTIQDSGDASPLLFSVNVHGISGLWGIPLGGFDIIPNCYTETFGSSTTWTINHNLNTLSVVVQVYDSTTTPADMIIPDRLRVTSANTVTAQFNVATAGRATVIAC